MLNQVGGTTGCSLADKRVEIAARIKQTGFNYSAFDKVLITKCDLCGNNTFSLYAHMDRYGLPIRSLKCSCGLIFISPRLKPKDYNTFYLDWYRKLVDAFNGRGNGKEIVKYSMEHQANAMLKFLGEHLPNELTIVNMLDVGGSEGIFAKKVCDTVGATGIVIDPNKIELDEALKKGLTTSLCQFEDYKTDRRFELISMLRTVEHLYSISKAFLKVHALLSDNGVFLFDIVNHEWLVRHFKDKTICTKIDHIYQLTDKTVRQYLTRFGFHVIGSTDKNERYISYLCSKIS